MEWFGWAAAAVVAVVGWLLRQQVATQRDEAERAHRQARAQIDDLNNELVDTRASATRQIRSARDDARHAVKNMAVALLPVEQSLTLAAEAQGDVESVRQGVHLVQKQLHGAMASCGVTPFEPALGEAFDPHTQECVATVGQGDVVQVSGVERRGWRLHERLLAPARVYVERVAVDSESSLNGKSEVADVEGAVEQPLPAAPLAQEADAQAQEPQEVVSEAAKPTA